MPLLGILLLVLALLCAWGLARRQATLGTGTGLGRPRSLPSLPLVGSLLQLAGHPQLHLRLWRLQGRYGSLYALWMGSHYVVVVNSYQHAREVLLKKGKAFAGRPRTVSQQQVSGGPPPAVAWAKVGDASKKGASTQQGPSPLLVLPAARQWRGSPSLPRSPGRILHILHPEGARSSPGLGASWGMGMWVQGLCTS